MNFLIAGLGAIGTVFATFLKSAGHNFYAFVKPYQKDLLKQRTLKVSGIWGVKEAVLDDIISEPSLLLRQKIDVVIVTVKSFDTESLMKDIHNYISTDAIFISAQNGYGNYETISKYAGKNRSLLARIIFGSKLISIGHAEVTVIADDVRIASPDGSVSKEITENIIKTINNSGIPTSFSENIVAVLWDKILYNCALNPLGAILECNYGTLASMDYTKNIMNKIIDEIFFVAHKHNIALNWQTAKQYKEHFYSKLIPPTRDHFPSMYYDLKAGKRTEIMALNGAIVSLGEAAGVNTPVNQTITDLILAKEKINKDFQQ